MLIQFRISNHRSIALEQELSFVAARLKSAPLTTISVPKYEIEVLPAIGIYGGNASGKSNVLKALSFMCAAVTDSQRQWQPDDGIPREPFRLDPEFLSLPSSFEVDILIKDTRYTYGFVIDSNRVLEEWLYAYPQGKKQSWFVRDFTQPTEFTFSRFLTGENKAIKSLTRPNSLFLSAAAQNNHQLLTPIFDWFASVQLIEAPSRDLLTGVASKTYLTSKFQAAMLELMKSADLGVTSIEIENEELPPESKQIIQMLFPKDSDVLKQMNSDPTIQRPLFHHHSPHSKSDIPFSFSLESRGTQVLFTIAAFVVTALAQGDLLCVDELDASLHPLVSAEIVKLFNDPETNKNHAQLLFNTHDTNILEAGNLRRDQIWFTEKDFNGSTRLYPLTDYKPRKQENIKRGYLQGRYGGVPFIHMSATFAGDESDGE